MCVFEVERNRRCEGRRWLRGEGVGIRAGKGEDEREGKKRER